MTLKEKLVALGINETDQASLNGIVDALIKTKVSARETELTTKYSELETKFKAHEATISEYKNKETKTLVEATGKKVFGDKYEKFSKYIKFPDGTDLTNAEAIEKLFKEAHTDLVGDEQQIENDPFEEGKNDIGVKTDNKDLINISSEELK